MPFAQRWIWAALAAVIVFAETGSVAPAAAFVAAAPSVRALEAPAAPAAEPAYYYRRRYYRPYYRRRYYAPRAYYRPRYYGPRYFGPGYHRPRYYQPYYRSY